MSFEHSVCTLECIGSHVTMCQHRKRKPEHRLSDLHSPLVNLLLILELRTFLFCNLMAAYCWLFLCHKRILMLAKFSTYIKHLNNKQTLKNLSNNRDLPCFFPPQNFFQVKTDQQGTLGVQTLHCRVFSLRQTVTKIVLVNYKKAGHWWAICLSNQAPL